MTANVGFTGTRDGATEEQLEEVEKILREQYGKMPAGPDFFHHGDCVGADYQAAQLAQCTGYKIIGHPPTNPKSRCYFESDKETEPKSYLIRNQEIINFSDCLIACPKSHIEEPTGGTWWTVRHARGKIPVYLVLPTGRLVIQ